MRKLTFFLLLHIGLTGAAVAQDSYKPMSYSSSGPHPKKDIYIKRLGPRYISDNKKYVAEWDTYLYKINQSYSSAAKGKQFITEPYVVKYLQSVLQPILTSNGITQKIEVVCTRYQEANAYNMGDNRLYVNIGLLQLLDNEAQLAFMLSHELSHLLLQHSQEKFLSMKNLASDKKIKREIKDIRNAKYNKLDRAQEFARQYTYVFANHSRAKERAADSMAIVLLQKSRYDIRQGAGLLDLLQKNDTDSIQVDYARFLGSAGYAINPERLQNSKYSISFGHKKSMTYDQDSVKTHPDIPARMAFIEQTVEKMKRSDSVEKFIVSATAFDSIKRAAKYEIIESYITNKRYAAAAYYTLNLLQDQPRNNYLIGKAAFILRDIVNAVKNHTIQDHIPIESEENALAYNQLLRLIDRTTLAELTQLYNNFLTNYAANLTNHPELKIINEKPKS